MTLPDPFLKSIRDAVGEKAMITDAGDREPYLVEERGLLRGDSDLVVRPATTDEVAAVVRACAAAKIPVVPLGGRTGLVGGGVAAGGIILSTERMTGIREVDALNLTITVEAGCVLADVQTAAAEADCLFPLSLGAEGSCRIGGNISTNAGGVGVLRYGNTRALVLGLEVVLPDGRIWTGLNGLRKDNTGYDLKQLFIGAEGTLGIITAAVLTMFPKPRTTVTALAAVNDLGGVMEVFARTRAACGDRLTAFETLSRRCVEFDLAHVPGAVDPFAAPHPHYVLIEATSPRAGDPLRDDLEVVLGAALEDGVVADAVFAESENQRKQIWMLRETIPEAQKGEGASIKHDVAVPVSRVKTFIEEATRAVEAAMPDIRVVAFGHIGDGNIHFNLSQPAGGDPKEFRDATGMLNRIVHDIVASMNGSISAEHGIGLVKRDELAHYKDAIDIDLMRTVKRALDPDNIMNPGKIVQT
jgi:D-lactate dehydrogenase (cytochrome)